MSLLSRFRILTKILVVIGVLSAVAVGITVLSINSLKQISEQAGLVAKVASNSMLLLRMNAIALTVNRAELQFASDPRPESRKAARADIEQGIKNFTPRLEELKKLPRADLKAQIDEIAKGWTDYVNGLGDLYKAGDAVQGVQMTAETQQLQNMAEASEKTADDFRLKMRNMADVLDKRVEAVTQDAVTEYESVSTMLMAMATAGIVLGLLLGFVTGQYGVAKPIGVLVRLLQRLARGEEVEITGTERKDEIGDTARAVNGIKAMLAEKAEHQVAERTAQDKQASLDREAARTRMAEELEAAVGSIVKAASAGDFTQRVVVEGKTGLVLSIGTAVNTLCDNVAKALDDLVDMLGALADGNMTQRITAEYQGNFALLKNNANTTAERIGSTIAEIKQSAREVTNASAEISTSTTDLSQRTEEQAASLEQTSASMEQISATVKKNAENAQQASQFATETREVADRGGQVVAEAVGAMSRIEDSSRKIGDIITVIDEIARQTNLLALNAAVEAARAGEAGRGFAVVASEVRTLAQRSAQAAKDIKDLISSSSSQVQQGVDLVNKAGSSLQEIVESVKRVALIVTEIASASAEQSVGIDQVNKALTQMDEVTQQNSALVEENAATAKTLEHQASAMDERVGFFKVNDLEGAEAKRAPAPSAAKLVASNGAARAGSKPVSKDAPKRAAALPPRRGPAARVQTAAAVSVKEDQDWKEF
jgi:methyl-accepting chemotaxis protein